MANYRDVLTPSQAEEMKQFLSALTKGAELCRQAGVRPDISSAITAWGHVPPNGRRICHIKWIQEKGEES